MSKETSKILNLEDVHWLSGDGPEQDVVVSSRLRLARNLEGFHFPHACHRESLLAVRAKAIDGLRNSVSSWHWQWLEKSTERELQVLRERHLLSPQMSSDRPGTAIAISPSGQISVMVNEEDHLRLQLLSPGLSLLEDWPKLLALDRKLEEYIDFAFHHHLGYLTSCLSNVGTGLRASVMLHLPALAWFNAIGDMIPAINSVGLTARGTHGEGSAFQGHFLQISNQVTLGSSEEEIVAQVSSVTDHFLKTERQARETLLKEHSLRVTDSVWRAWGIVENARLISVEEATEHLSLLRLGGLLGILPAIQSGLAFQLMVGIRPGHLEKLYHQSFSTMDCDAARADYLRSTLRENIR